MATTKPLPTCLRKAAFHRHHWLAQTLDGRSWAPGVLRGPPQTRARPVETERRSRDLFSLSGYTMGNSSVHHRGGSLWATVGAGMKSQRTGACVARRASNMSPGKKTLSRPQSGVRSGAGAGRGAGDNNPTPPPPDALHARPFWATSPSPAGPSLQSLVPFQLKQPAGTPLLMRFTIDATTRRNARAHGRRRGGRRGRTPMGAASQAPPSRRS